MNTRTAVLFYLTLFSLTSCAPHSPIDAKKTNVPHAKSNVSKDTASLLTDKDIFGNETTLAISEDDIQAALEGDVFHVPLNSSVILVQSGNRAPDTIMQQEMSKYYTLSTFSGIPDRQKIVSCNKDENGETVTSENINWMQALRYVAAKGHQKAIIVYQGTLQSGKYDDVTKSTLWSDYKNETLTEGTALRYLVRFTLVDVASGDWATWSPLNSEYSILPSQSGKTGTEFTEQQIAQLKQKTYSSMVKDLVNRYQ